MAGDPRGVVEEQMVWLVVTNEGGFADHPDDRGGATSRGMTAEGWHEHAGVWLTGRQLAALPDEAILRGHVDLAASKSGFDRLADWRPRLVAMDWAMHSGRGTAVRHLQRIIGADDDGVFGPQTDQRANSADPEWLAARLLAVREHFLIELIHHDSSQRTFVLGWWDRCARLADVLTGERREVA